MFLRLAALFISAFFSQAEAKVLTWADCVQSVSSANPDLQAARENEQSSEAVLGGSRSGFFPSLTGSVNASHQFPNSVIPYLDAHSAVSYSSSLALNYNLFSGFKDVATVERAKGALNASKASLDGIRATVSDRLRQSFIGLVYAQANVKLTASIIERRAQNDRMIRAQYENGRENQGSYLLSQSKLEQSRFDYLVATHEEVSAREALAHVLGFYDSDLSIQGDLPRQDPPVEPSISLKDLVPLTPTHRIQEGQVQESEASVKLANSGFYPSLDFTGAVVNSNHLLYTNDNQAWSVGLALTIPLFSGLSTYYSVKSAHALERAATETEFFTDLSTYENLRQTLFTFQESVQKLRVDQLSLQALEVQERIATKQYNNGLMTFENWDIIEGNLVAAQKTALASTRDRDIAESNFRLAQGLGDLP